MKNTKGITLIEIIVAMLLTGILIVVAGFVIVTTFNTSMIGLRNFSRHSEGRVALEHLRKNIERAAYVEIPGPAGTNTRLEVYNYSGARVGTYDNTVDGLTFSGTASMLFAGVSVTFEGMNFNSGRATKVKAVFTSPFTLTAYIKPRCDIGSVTWAKAYGVGNGLLGTHTVQQTTDEGYILGGGCLNNIRTGDDEDFLLIKTNLSGTVKWAKIYGRIGIMGIVRCLQQTTPDGGYILSGVYKHTNTSPMRDSAFLIKTNSSGVITWAKTYDLANYSSCFFTILQTPDLGYICAGQLRNTLTSHKSALVVKVNSSGTVQWAKQYSNNIQGGGRLLSVHRTAAGEYFFCGMRGVNVYDVDEGKTWVMKTSSTGNHIWSKLYDYIDYSLFTMPVTQGALSPTTDGGYVFDCLVKIDSSGNIELKKTYTISARRLVLCKRQQTVDSKYILMGNVVTGMYETQGQCFAGTTNIVMIKVDSSGVVEWAKEYVATPTQGVSYGQQTSDNGYILEGYTDSFGAATMGSLLIKTGPLGELDCHTINTSNIKSSTTTTDTSITIRNRPTTTDPNRVDGTYFKAVSLTTANTNFITKSAPAAWKLKTTDIK